MPELGKQILEVELLIAGLLVAAYFGIRFWAGRSSALTKLNALLLAGIALFISALFWRATFIAVWAGESDSWAAWTRQHRWSYHALYLPLLFPCRMAGGDPLSLWCSLIRAGLIWVFFTYCWRKRRRCVN